MKKQKPMSNEIVKQQQQQFPALTPENSIAIASNITEMGLSIFDLPRMKVPSGGVTAWEIQTLSGVEYAKERDVVILASRGGQRAWYRSAVVDGAGAPPDCSSQDGITGTGVNTLEGGKPGKHECSSCPWDQWKSKRGGADSNAKDCKEFAQVLVATIDGSMPTLVTVPPTSLKALKAYAIKLMDGGKRHYTVVTRLSLEKVSGSGPDYSRIKFDFVRDLEASDSAAINDLAVALKAALFKVSAAQSAQHQ